MTQRRGNVAAVGEVCAASEFLTYFPRGAAPFRISIKFKAFPRCYLRAARGRWHTRC